MKVNRLRDRLAGRKEPQARHRQFDLLSFGLPVEIEDGVKIARMPVIEDLARLGAVVVHQLFEIPHARCVPQHPETRLRNSRQCRP